MVKKLKLHESSPIARENSIFPTRRFSVYGGKVSILENFEDSLEVVKELKILGDFNNITQFLIKLNHQDSEIPKYPEAYFEVDFNSLDSRIRMLWETEDGTIKGFSTTLYEVPCWMQKSSLNQFGIQLH